MLWVVIVKIGLELNPACCFAGHLMCYTIAHAGYLVLWLLHIDKLDTLGQR